MRKKKKKCLCMYMEGGRPIKMRDGEREKDKQIEVKIRVSNQTRNLHIRPMKLYEREDRLIRKGILGFEICKIIAKNQHILFNREICFLRFIFIWKVVLKILKSLKSILPL